MEKDMLIQYFKNRMDVSIYIASLKEDDIQKLCNYYKAVVDHYKISANKGDYIKKYREVYEVLLSPTFTLIMSWLMTGETNTAWYKTITKYKTSDDSACKQLYSCVVFGTLYKEISGAAAKDFGLQYVMDVQVKDITNVLNYVAAELEDERVAEQIDIEEDGLDDYLSDETEDEVELDQELDDSKPTEKTDKDYSDLKRVWGPRLKPTVDNIMLTFESLYSSGYGLLSPVGVLTNIGVVATRASDGKLITRGADDTNGDLATDRELYFTIKNATGDQFETFSKSLEDETYEKISSLSTPLTMTFFHLRNTFGHIKFCTHKHSLTHYLTQHGLENNGSKVKKWSDMRGYIREAVENAFFEAYEYCGIPSDVSRITEDVLDAAKKIEYKVTSSLKNVVIVAERKANVNTRLRICTNVPLASIENAIKNTLNKGTTIPVIVKTMSNKNGVYDINIIYNDKAYSQDALFAYQIVDKLNEQGIVPSWSNVILGKDMDGNIYTRNFKDANNSTVAIYGAKGSGKGVMTLNLVASALASGCDLIYIDGKPDTAICLANAAWTKGLDACIFNGLDAARGAGLETNKTCIRNMDRFLSKKYIPQGMFLTEEQMEQFILLTTYYRGLELVLEMSKERAGIVTKDQNATLDTWLVAVFDECQQLASTETNMLAYLDSVQDKRKKAEEEYVDAKGNTKVRKITYTRDPIWKFIEEYKQWRSILQTDMKTALGSTFRKAQITVFYIWQTTDFPDKYANTSIIASAIKQEGGPMVKIVGRAALSKGGSTTFGTPNSVSSDASWYDEKFSGDRGGYWAIGNDVNNDSAMKVFRPFNVYSNAGNKQLLIDNAKAAGQSEEDLIGVSLNEDRTVKQEIGFEGYTNKLLANIGLDTATQLNIGFTHANEFVSSHGLAQNLLQFMYNAHQFTGEDMGAFDEEDKGFAMPNNGADAPATNTTGQPQVSPTSPISNPATGTGSAELDPKTTAGMSEQLKQRAALSRMEMLKHQREEMYKNLETVETDEDDDVEIDLSSSDAGEVPNPANPEISGSLGGIAEQLAQQAGMTVEEYTDTYSKTTSQNGEAATSTDSSGNITIDPSKTDANKRVVTPENTIFVDYSKPKGLKALALNTIRGADAEFKNRWGLILKALKSGVNDPSVILDLQIFDTTFQVGKRHVDIANVLVCDDEVITLDLLINFTSLAQTFPNVKNLVIDSMIFAAADAEFRDKYQNGVYGLFKVFKRLNTLMTVDVVDYKSDDPNKRYQNTGMFTRDMFLDELQEQAAVVQAQTEAEKQAKREEKMRAHEALETIKKEQALKAKIDAAAALKSPQGAGKSVVEKAALNKRLLNTSGEAFSSSWNSFLKSGSSAAGSLAYAALGVVTGVGGLFTKAFSALFGAFRRK